MSQLDCETLRARVAAAIVALSGWRQSTLPYDLFPDQTAQQGNHKVVAVGVPRTQWASPKESRRSEGPLVASEVRVRWTHQIRQDAAVSDYDEALGTERDIIAAVLQISELGLHIWADSATRRISGQGTWLEGEIAFGTNHRLSL